MDENENANESNEEIKIKKRLKRRKEMCRKIEEIEWRRLRNG